jgi:hypothetical protein
VNKLCKSKADSEVFKSMFVGMNVHKNYLQVALLFDSSNDMHCQNKKVADIRSNEVSKVFSHAEEKQQIDPLATSVK